MVDGVLTVREVAGILKLTEKTVYAMAMEARFRLSKFVANGEFAKSISTDGCRNEFLCLVQRPRRAALLWTPNRCRILARCRWSRTGRWVTLPSAFPKRRFSGGLCRRPLALQCALPRNVGL